MLAKKNFLIQNEKYKFRKFKNFNVVNIKSLRIILTISLIIAFTFLGISFVDEKFFDEKLQPILTDPNFKIQIVQVGLDFPTKFTFIDNSTILVAQKSDGKIMVIKNFKLQKEPAVDLNVESHWERGLSGLISTKNEGKNLVFVYYTESISSQDTSIPGIIKDGNRNNGNKLVRYSWNGTKLIDPILILHPIPYSGTRHQGGAMIVHDDSIYLVVGDNLERGILTNVKKEVNFDRGVIFRINFDGKPVSSNPFSGNFSKYFAYGIRNGYGLAVDPVTQNIWATENGPRNWDEVNLVFPGFNGGWRKIMGPQNVSKITSETSELVSLDGSNYSDPEFSWKKAIGVTEIEFLNSKKYGKEYENDLFIGDVFGNLYHFELNGTRNGFAFSDPLLEDNVADNQAEASSLIFGKNLGVITDIKQGPDGYLYLVSMIQSENINWAKIEKDPLSNKIFEENKMTGVLFRIVPN